MDENFSMRNNLGLYGLTNGSKKGILYEKNEIRHELPEVGTKVIVKELRILKRAHGKDENGYVHTTYKVKSDCKDAYDKPKVFIVEGYTLPKEQALSRHSFVRLRYQSPYNSNYTQLYELGTLYIVTGSIKLEAIEEGGE